MSPQCFLLDPLNRGGLFTPTADSRGGREFAPKKAQFFFCANARNRLWDYSFARTYAILAIDNTEMIRFWLVLDCRSTAGNLGVLRLKMIRFWIGKLYDFESKATKNHSVFTAASEIFWDFEAQNAKTVWISTESKNFGFRAKESNFFHLDRRAAKILGLRITTAHRIFGLRAKRS